MMVDGKINDRWPLRMPAERAAFHARKPGWEAGRLAHMRERVGPGSVIFDVGAELGDFSALYQTWLEGWAGLVLIEPSDGYWPTIRATFEANGLRPMSCVVGFASDQTTAGAFPESIFPPCAPGCDPWPPQASLPENVDAGFRALCETGDASPQWRLDDIASELGTDPTVVVVDVEGAELRVLQGASDLMERARPLFYVEVHDHILGDYGTRFGEIARLLFRHDYATELVGWNGTEHWFFAPRETLA